MMKLIINSEPYVFEHKCSNSERTKLMTFQEKKQLLIDNLLDVYSKCGTEAYAYPKPKVSVWSRFAGITNNTQYPDIVINNYHGLKGVTAYYYVFPKGEEEQIDLERIPEEIKSSWVKIISGSVFCLESQRPDYYIKGYHYVAQYESKAILPAQENLPLSQILTDKELAIVYTEAWKKLDTSRLVELLDKDFHYQSDVVFDDMSSREEYLDYLNGKFRTLRRTLSIQRVELGRNGENGEWTTLVKQIQSDGTPIVCGFFIKSDNGRIKSVHVHEMDLPEF